MLVTGIRSRRILEQLLSEWASGKATCQLDVAIPFDLAISLLAV